MANVGMYQTSGGYAQGLNSGLRTGQAISGMVSNVRLQDAAKRLQSGEDQAAVMQSLMAQDPAAAQALLDMQQKQTQLSREQGEVEQLKKKYGMQALQQSAIPLFGAVYQDNPEIQNKLIDEASTAFKGQSDGVFEMLQGIKGLQGADRVNALAGIVKALRSAGVYPDDPMALMQGQGTALSQNLALYDRALASGDTERAEIIKRNLDPYSRSLSGGMGAGEAKIATEQKLNPVLGERSQVTAAGAERGKQQAGTEADIRKNAVAFNTYQTAIKQLEDAASKTATNPVAGMLPAVSANAQIMESAISMMAPVLKEMFRQSGEGTFTDKDQELLLQMVPTRGEHPEAIKAKLGMIDNLVRAKLQQQSSMPQQKRNFEQQYMGGN